MLEKSVKILYVGKICKFYMLKKSANSICWKNLQIYMNVKNYMLVKIIGLISGTTPKYQQMRVAPIKSTPGYYSLLWFIVMDHFMGDGN